MITSATGESGSSLRAAPECLGLAVVALARELHDPGQSFAGMVSMGAVLMLEVCQWDVGGSE